MRARYRWAIVAVATLVLLLTQGVQAAVVGRFTAVTGQVDLLKQGKLPAVPVKVQDGVETGDVIRTKSKAKAQLKFVDDTTLTLAPESRVAVADYVFDPAAKERRAVLCLFRGLVHTVVSQILQVQEPEFLMQTVTAVIGVRGTEFYTLLTPKCAYVYLLRGLLSTASTNPQIPLVVMLEDRQKNVICLDQPPGTVQVLTAADEAMLKRFMDAGVPASFGLLPWEAPPPPRLELPPSPERLMSPTIPPTLQAPRKEYWEK
jgi:hypothetical protein